MVLKKFEAKNFVKQLDNTQNLIDWIQCQEFASRSLCQMFAKKSYV